MGSNPDQDRWLLDRIWSELGGAADAPDTVTFTGPAQTLPSVFDVSALASATVAAATLAVADLEAVRRGRARPLSVQVDRRHVAAAFRSERYVEAIGWELSQLWDAVAGDYRTSDGWIRLHTNYPHHRRAALAVLGVDADRAAVAKQVEQWSGNDLETAVVDAGGCAAVMRTIDEWRSHPQARALGQEPIVGRTPGPASSAVTTSMSPWASRPSASASGPRPLAGIRVLDLTRVIAGPVCTRLLAAYGAQVLRIDPPMFEEPTALLVDTTAGKRRATLDFTDPDDRVTFEGLITEADVIVHGYRSDALDHLGFGTDRLWSMNPTLVITALDAYGWTGPWATRRGFDSLVQMSCGIAARGQAVAGSDRPSPLPAQALDHGTGYLMAAATCRSLAAGAAGADTSANHLSLARTAQILVGLGETGDPALEDFTRADADPWREVSDTGFGPVRRVSCPGRIDGIEPEWTIPPGPVGIDEPVWPDRGPAPKVLSLPM